jgi:hypothetical protein
VFDDSDLKQKIEGPGFLRPGLCMFGDNAYINTSYMCTPWRNVSSGPKDAFNFFHSQLRINIECAFGELVHRWSIQRKPMPMNISIKKICYLVYVLCKLHNYCISNRDAIYSPIDSDSSYVVMEGGLFLPRMENSREAFWEYDLSGADRLCALLDGGDHTDDHTPNGRRNQARKYSDKDLPCNVILQHAERSEWERPEHSSMRLGRK